jgi:hypothetical protein
MTSNHPSADNPFILPSTLITLQPFLLAADLSVKLHVDDRWLHADLRVDRAHFGSSGRLPDLLNCALLVRTIDADLAHGRP